MPRVSVSEAFYKQLKSLRLNEYPIVGGHVKKDARKPNEFDENEKEKSDEIVEMIDLIKDKKSPWYETYEWSKDCESIRERYIKDKSSINRAKIEQYFTNLRLNSLNIDLVDENVKNFLNLEELILSCNLIWECNLSNLPSSLKIFDISANLIDNIHCLTLRTRTSIQHLGLAYNKIEVIEDYFNPKYWNCLVSLDLSSNNIQNLIGLLNELESLKNLKILILSRNPAVLLPGYRGLVVDSLPNLFSLDDIPINKDEKINYQDFKLYAQILSDHAEIKFNFMQIKNLIFPEIPDYEDEPEIFLYKYSIRFDSIEDLDFEETLTYKKESTVDMDPMTNMDLNEKGIVRLQFKSIMKLRDFLQKGTQIELVEKKIYYQSKNYEPPSEEELKKKKKEKKDDKKEEKKDKKKKKTNASFLENYNIVNVEENILAEFRLELESVLDGHSKEIDKNYKTKQKVDLSLLASLASAVTKNVDSKKNKKDEKASKSAKKKSEPDLKEPIEQPPLEINLKFQVLDFNNFKELKDYLDQNVNVK